MFDINFKIDGIEELQKMLGELPASVLDSVRDFAITFRNLVRGRTPYVSGHAKQSWSDVEYQSGGFTFGSDAPHIKVLEEGLYKTLGPRTVDVGGDIYSRQAPGGIIAPLIEDEETIADLLDLVVQEIKRVSANVGA